MLASGSQAAGALIVAIDTTGKTNVQVSWRAGTILQQASRDHSVALQFRVGHSGNFTDVGTASTYTSQGQTAGSFSGTFTETLPEAASTNSEVQVRWVYWESNGSSGSRDRIAVDEIAIDGDDQILASAPSVTTSPGYGTNTTEVTLGGNVTDDGGASVTNRGVVYKTSSGVTISDNKTPIGSGTGAFSNEISSLSVNTRYYFRAYAQNSAGTTLGTELFIWTWANVPSAPTVGNPTSSSLDVTINENGNPSSTEFAVQRTSDSQYLKADGTWGATEVWQTKTAWGTVSATGLDPGTTYYFQVKARNGANTETAFGSTGSETTLGSGCSSYWHALYDMGGPIWTNYPGDSLTYTFEFAINVDTTGWDVDYGIGTTTDGSGWTWRDADWSRMDGPENRVWISKENEHVFTSTGNWYYAGRFDDGGGCIYYGDQDWEATTGGGLSATNFFLVSALTAPNSQSATAASASQINLSWTRGVSGVAKDTIIFRSTSATPPTLSDGTPYSQGNTYSGYDCVYKGSGTATSDAGLTQGTTYYYYFFAVNNDYYSSIVTDDATTWTTPTVTTTPVDTTNQTTAAGGGNVTADGGTTVTNRGVVWGLSVNPTVPGAQTTNGTGTGSFSSTLTNLVPGQTYHYRAFAQNVVGTSYGADYTLIMPCFTGVVTGVHVASSNDTYFGAAWDALPGASGYSLDVSTNAQFGTAAAASDLFISEYVEGSGSEKYIEIFNGTGGSVDLSDYALVLYVNGSSSQNNSNNLSGTLNDGEVVVYRNSSATNTAIATSLAAINFNGDDAIALWNRNTASWADIFGRIGEDPGSAWTDGAFSTVDKTLVRKSSVMGGVTSNPGSGFPTLGTEWDQYGTSDESHLGSHTFDGGIAPDYVSGYSNRTVAGNSTTVTGLTPAVTYYFRVRATNEFCETDNSATASVTTILVAPGVIVLGTNGSTIADGETTPSYAAGTDFGVVGVNLSNVVRTFTITNSGNSALGLGNVTTSGTHAADFIVVSQPAASVAAGDTTTFQVRFDPSAAGTRTATIQFTNNVIGKSPYDFAVQGTGVLAGVYASPTSISVTTMVGTAVGTRSFGVTNVGLGRLDYSVATNADWLSVSPVSAQLAEKAGQQETITFNVTGLSAGTSNATITISGGATASNSANVNVTLILTNIPDSTAQSATADGKELVRVQWTRPAGYDVMIVHRENNGPTSPPLQGQPYSVGDTFGGAKVVYSGSGAYLDHVVPPGSMDVYVFYTINNDHYSPGVTATVSMVSYGPIEHVDQFGYTNGVSLNGLSGGQGWSGAWSVGAGNFTVSSNGPTPNLYVNSNYPPVAAQRILVTNTVNNTEMRARRDFTAVTNGALYVSYIMAVQYGDYGKYTGIRLLSNGLERAFIGEVGGDNILGLDSFRSAGVANSGFNINSFDSNTGNVYVVFARYSFSTHLLSAKAYYRTQEVPEAEPAVWDVSETADADRTYVDGIELVTGGFDNNYPGVVAFDEVRIATNWSDIIPSSGTPGISLVPSAYTVTVMRGSSPVMESFTVTNVGLGVLSYDVATNADWISVSPTIGTLSAGIGQSHTLSLDVTDLAVGIHTGGIIVTSGTASNSPQHAQITVTVTNIPAVAGGSVIADGKEMVRLGWTPQAGVQTLILHDDQAITVDPTQGTPYSVDDTVGTARVIYIGPSAGALEHIVAQGSTNYYAAYTLNGNYTATRANLGNVTMPLYRPEEIVDQLAYTNSLSLLLPSGNGGQGWTTAWTNAEGTWTVLSNNHAEISFPTVNSYPTNAANMVKMSDPGASTTSRVQRFFAPVSTGAVYIAAYVGYQYEGPNKFAGISFLSGGSETGFVGKISDGGHDYSLGIDTYGAGRVFSGYDLHGLSVNTNNTYLLIGKYDLDAGNIYAVAYHRTETVPDVEPVTWYATASATGPAAIDGVMLIGGADAGTIGNVYFDEIRVARSWEDLVDRHLPTVLTRPITSILETTASGGGEVTSDGGLTVTNRGVVWATNGVPTIADSLTSDGTGVGIYASSLTGLVPGETYYVRAYAQNAIGISYGDVSNFTAACFSSVVTGLYVNPTNDTDFTLHWSPLTGATGYQVDVSLAPDFGGGSGNYGVETFTTTNIGGGTVSSYLTRQWTNNGVAWTGYLARTDQDINSSDALTLQNASGAYLISQPITGGVTEIHVTHQLAFTGADVFDIFVNGTKVATNIAYSASVQTAVVQNLNISGAFTIMITNHSGGRLSIDNLTWTNTGSSYVPGYENRAVAGTSEVVTGLESSVTYYYRVRATTPNCVSDDSATGTVATLDRISPDLFGFNVDGGTFTDEQVLNGFSVTGMVFDADAGILNAAGTPYFFIYNSSGTLIATSNKFTTAPINGATAPSALAGTFGPVAQADVVLGIYTATVGAVDLAGNIAVSNFVFTVVDDDADPPALVNITAPVTNGGALRAMQISLGGSNFVGSGGTTNWIYRASDGELTAVSALQPLRFWIGARDDSKINRGTTDPATNMNLTIDGIVVSNVANYDASFSSSLNETTNSRPTNVWTWVTRFSDAEITMLMTNTASGLGTNLISVTMSDADADRIGDSTGVVNQQYGYLVVTDDDTTPPVVGLTDINGVGAGGIETTIFVETMGTAGANADSIATHETNNRFDNVSFTMSGTGDMRDTTASSGYTGASGVFNVMLNATNEYFQIAGIDSSAYQNMRLAFGIKKALNASDGSNLIVEVSTNGTDWAAITMPALPTGTGTAGNWHLITNAVGVIPPSPSLSIRFTVTDTEELRIDDVRLFYQESNLMLTDGDIAWGGYVITSRVHDAISGIAVSNAFAPNYVVLNPTGQQVVASDFDTAFADGSATTSTPVTATASAAGSTNWVTLGIYTTMVYATDADDDLGNVDRLGATNSLVFTVVDDDTNAPAASGFFLSGGTTNFDLGDGSVVVTGMLSDASGVLYDGTTHFVLLDSAGAVVQSNVLYAGAGSAATGLVYAGVLNCGEDYTLRVFAADADLDRPDDQMSITQAVMVIRTIGVGGPADYPIASNLLVNGVAASPLNEIMDETIATGGWSMAFNLSHPVGVFTNASSPSFRVTNEVGEVIADMPWTNGVHVGDTYFFTNNNLPSASYSVVQTGLHYVVWSASNQGSCVAMIIDRGAIADGTNLFMVVDDDDLAPVPSAFAIAGQSTTIDVATAMSGFTVTGLLHDAGSGIGFTSSPPYLLFYDVDGATILASNTLSGGAEGDGKAAAIEVNAAFSGLDLTCGYSYTVRVFAADADNDRLNDATADEAEALVISTGGAEGDSPTAENLLVNNTAAATVTLTDQMIATGGWRVAVSFTHPSENIITNGPNAPSFKVLGADGTNVYGSGTILWDNLIKDGSTYYATNYPMLAADTNLVTTGRFSIVWSAQTEGLCYGAESDSALINPGTNTFLVIDDDTELPNFLNLEVGGGTGSECGGGGVCADPTRTNLIAGDIAIIAMNTLTKGGFGGGTNYDSFAWVALVDIPTGTEIKFTDNGWMASQNKFRNNEGTLTWRATDCVGAGTVVRWIVTNTPVISHGQIIATNGNFAPNIEGEQIFAYQGPDASPNFIYALNDRTNGLWDVDATDSHTTALPPGLADGYTAVAVGTAAGDLNNVIINTNILSISGTRETILYYVGDKDNWIGDDEIVYDLLQFNFSFPDLCASGGIITDEDMLLGRWNIAGILQDIGSGLVVSNDAAPRYMVLNTNAGVVVSNFFTTAFAHGSKAANSISNTIPDGDYYTIQLGVHTAVLWAADADADRTDDALEQKTNIAFTVVDDDYDLPQIGFFSINGGISITNAADLFSVVISGRVRDVTSGIAFTSAPPQYAVIDSLGYVVASGGFANAPASEGDATDWEGIWTTPMNLAGIADCGIYTVRVTVADADNDRVGDRMQTNLNFLISVAAGNGDDPVASNLLVNAMPAPIATLTDGELRAGGWSLAMTMHHPIGVATDDPYEPGFKIHNPNDTTVIADLWTNVSDGGAEVYVTNDYLAAIPYVNVMTGYHSVLWSARSLGACFGEVFDSPFFADGTNLILVVDDDTVGPGAASNFVSTATYWTNNPVVTYTWDTSAVYDASGVATFRLVTNNIAPTTMVEGVDVGLTNIVTLTNMTEGVITNWLYAIDADDDRSNDGAMGAVTNTVLYLDFTPPSQVSNFSAAPGMMDNTSEIDLNWTALPDGGGAHLSPWDTYRVYYTQDSGDPTTNDLYFDADVYLDLATNATTALTIEGLAMGSEYRVAIAGRDRAGNLGPISGVQTVMLGQITITQAFANAVSNPELYWEGSSNSFYDVIYADGTGYTVNIDLNWRLAATVQGTKFVDVGGYDAGTTNYRVAPIDLPNKWMRYYRIAAANAWIPTWARQGSAATQVVVALKTVLTNGHNFIGMGMQPFENTLADFLGTNRMPSGNDMTESASVYVYTPREIPEADSNVWWLSSDGGWQYEIGGASANTQALPYPNRGFDVLLPISSAPTNYLVVGRVPWSDQPNGITIEPNKNNVLALNLPRPTRISETGLNDILTRAPLNLWRFGDEIRVLNRGGGPYDAPKARIYVLTNGTYRFIPNNALADNYVVEVDDSIIVWTPFLAAPALWTMPLPYTPPTLRLTNYFPAPPIVALQAPADITENSVILRGTVTPNGLPTSAEFLYGPTTNYGFSIGFTNLPATNITFQIADLVSGLSTGTLYYYRLYAENSMGESRFGTGSFATDGYCTNAVPSAPGATASDGTSGSYVSVTWGDGPDESGYEVWRNTINDSGTAAHLATKAVNVTSHDDTSATPGQRYYYWIKAFNCAGSSAFGSTDYGYRKLATVDDVAASYNTFTNRVEIEWSDVQGETGYGVYRYTSDNSGSAAYLGTVGAGALVYTDETAVVDTDYYYWIRATNSTSSSQGDFQASGAPGRRSSSGFPTLSSPTATGISASGATLGATVDSDGGSTVTSRGTVWGATPAPTGNSASEGGSGTGAFSHSRSGMPAGKLIYFRGWASNNNGIAYSEDGSFWTVPDAPVLSSATAVLSDSFQANWNSVIGATNYFLDVSTSSSFGSFVPGYNARPAGNGVSFAVTNLDNSTYYYWRVSAGNSGGISVHSTTNIVFTPTNAPTTQAHSIFFTSVGSTQMTVNWTNGNGQGRIIVARQGGAPSQLPENGATYTANNTFGAGSEIGVGNFVVGSESGYDPDVADGITVTGLSPASAYFFKVYEYNGSGLEISYQTVSGGSNPNGQMTTP